MDKKCYVYVLVKDEYGNWDWHEEAEDEWLQDTEDEEPEDELWRYPTAHRNESGGWCSPLHGNTCGYHHEHSRGE